MLSAGWAGKSGAFRNAVQHVLALLLSMRRYCSAVMRRGFASRFGPCFAACDSRSSKAAPVGDPNAEHAADERCEVQRSDAKCSASASISALVRSARSGSGFEALPCARLPARISCSDHAV